MGSNGYKHIIFETEESNLAKQMDLAAFVAGVD